MVRISVAAVLAFAVVALATPVPAPQDDVENALATANKVQTDEAFDKLSDDKKQQVEKLDADIDPIGDDLTKKLKANDKTKDLVDQEEKTEDEGQLNALDTQIDQAIKNSNDQGLIDANTQFKTKIAEQNKIFQGARK